MPDDLLVALATVSDVWVASIRDRSSVTVLIQTSEVRLLTDADIRESNTNVVLNAVSKNEQFELDVEE